MRRPPEQIDEYILAAYLSGELPTRLRKEIAAYLADNPRAREILGMATDAMDVIESGGGVPLRLVDPSIPGVGEIESATQPASGLQSPGIRRAENNKFLWRIVGLVSAAVLVLAITLAIHVALELRAGSENATEFASDGWEPAVEIDQLRVTWPEVTGAASYHVVLYDPVGEFVVSTDETTYTSFEDLLDGVDHVAAATGGNLQIWIEAFDPAGDYLQASRRVTVSLQ